MDDVQAQYESLSDKLAREASLGSTAPETVTGDTTISGKSKLKSSLKSKMKAKKVKWAETAAIASTMDGDNADEYDDEDYVPRSPLDILSDLFAKKYTLPIFLFMSAGIFLMVHLAGGPSDASFRRYGDDSGYGGGGNQPSALSRGYSYLVGSNRQRNVGGGDGFGDISELLNDCFLLLQLQISLFVLITISHGLSLLLLQSSRCPPHPREGWTVPPASPPHR